VNPSIETRDSPFPPTDYEKWCASSLGRAYLSSVRDVLRGWIEGTSFTRAADIGCGPGITTEGLFSAEAWPLGVDCSFEMARRAVTRARERGVAAASVAGKIEALPLRDGSVDLVLCINCLEFVERREVALREIARVLRPGGTAIVGVMNRRSAWEITRRLRRPFTDRPYYRGRFFSEDEVRGRLEEAGLAVLEVRCAAHFPPIPPGPLAGLYRGLDGVGTRLRSKGGAVLLARSRRR
jgi:ubiquinone/menaquinone biosynthesis C-methylase UbiE